jgi:hypothetical protein
MVVWLVLVRCDKVFSSQCIDSGESSQADPADRTGYMRMNCRVCGSQVDYFAEAQILNQHQIKYFRCVQCSFIQTENTILARPSI